VRDNVVCYYKNIQMHHPGVYFGIMTSTVQYPTCYAEMASMATVVLLF